MNVAALGSDIAVVIVTFNSEPVVAKAVESVRAHLPAAQLIVVDNGSTDGTMDVVRATASTATILTGHGNVGFGRGCTLGAEAADRPIVFFLNPDAVIVRLDATAVSALSTRSDQWGSLACQVADGVAERSLLRPIWPWPLEVLWANYIWFVKPGSFRGTKVRFLGRRNYASGAATFVRRDALAAVNGFNERIFLYYEDLNLAARLLRQGWSVEDFKGLAVTHIGQASSPRTLDRELTWASLGLLEHIADFSSPATTVVAARLMLGLLTTVGRVGKLVEQLSGGNGSRAMRKARDAEAVREGLIRAATGKDGPTNNYERAVRALRTAIRES